MNRAKSNEILKKIEEDIPEAKISHHTLSAPTVGKTHRWKQKGTAIVCESCESSHGFYVNIEDILTGIDEKGMPIIGKKY